MIANEDVCNDGGIHMLDSNRKTYFDLSLELFEIADILGVFQAADSRIKSGKYQHMGRQCIQHIGYLQNKIANLRFEIEHMPPRQELLILEDIATRQQKIDELEHRTHYTPSHYIPYDDWMGSCAGDKDYESFWARIADQRMINMIKSREIPALENELARTKQMAE